MQAGNKAKTEEHFDRLSPEFELVDEIDYTINEVKKTWRQSFLSNKRITQAHIFTLFL